MKKFILARAFALALPLAANAQTPEVTVGKPFTVQWDQNGIATDGFKVSIDATEVVRVPVSALVLGTATSTLSAPAEGMHILSVVAYNRDKESVPASTTFKVVLPTPATPSNLRIIVSAPVASTGVVDLKQLELKVEVVP